MQVKGLSPASQEWSLEAVVQSGMPLHGPFSAERSRVVRLRVLKEMHSSTEFTILCFFFFFSHCLTAQKIAQNFYNESLGMRLPGKGH